MEAGAADCEFSVSLPLEKHYGWTGSYNKHAFSVKHCIVLILNFFDL